MGAVLLLRRCLALLRGKETVVMPALHRIIWMAFIADDWKLSYSVTDDEMKSDGRVWRRRTLQVGPFVLVVSTNTKRVL